MNIGEDVLLAGFAEHFSAEMDVLLVTGEVDVLLAVLALEMIATDVLAPMILKTEFTPKRTSTIRTELLLSRNTFLVSEVAFGTDVRTIVPLFVTVSLIAVVAIVTARKEPGYTGNQIKVIIL